MYFYCDVFVNVDMFLWYVLCFMVDDVFIGMLLLVFIFGLGGLVVFLLWVGVSILFIEWVLFESRDG